LNLPPAPAAVRDEQAIDRATVEQALERAHGVVAHAARDLGLTRQALYRRMEKLGLKTEAGLPRGPGSGATS
jgi:transcriptional regulator with GAF, ATPase, and Fis domain